MNDGSTISRKIEVNPYEFQKDVLEWMEMEPNGNYVVQKFLDIDLKIKPTSPVKGISPGCAGDCFTLAEDGHLLIMKGFTFNGPNFVDDAACRMLASMVHDALCSESALGQYRYVQRQRFYKDILLAQGEAKWFANVQFGALVAFNWMVSRKKK